MFINAENTLTRGTHSVPYTASAVLMNTRYAPTYGSNSKPKGGVLKKNVDIFGCLEVTRPFPVLEEDKVLREKYFLFKEIAVAETVKRMKEEK